MALFMQHLLLQYDQRSSILGRDYKCLNTSNYCRCRDTGPDLTVEGKEGFGLLNLPGRLRVIYNTFVAFFCTAYLLLSLD